MHVATTDSAFAALCREGDAARVVAWGHAEYGGSAPARREGGEVILLGRLVEVTI